MKSNPEKTNLRAALQKYTSIKHAKFYSALRVLFLSAIAIITGTLAFAQDATPTSSPTGVILSLNGVVTPANAQYLTREIEAANATNADLIVIEIDTPGGLVTSMKTIIKSILASDAPVATFVSPQGARSASAGLYIMYAAHISAMAPSTNTGAATPVEVGGGGQSPNDNPFEGDTPFKREKPPSAPTETPEPDNSSDTQLDSDIAETEQDEANSSDGLIDTVQYKEEILDNEETGDTIDQSESEPLSNEDAMRAKIINDSVAYIRSLAEERGRNADWAEKAVRDAASVTSREALSLGVIDIVAEDLDDLLTRIDGRTVKTVSGEKTITTQNIQLTRVEPSLVERILGFIADPNVAVILMSLATTGIIIEMWNPGSIFPGTLGAVCLILGLYSFQVLPFNWMPLALMGVGVILMTIEAYTPTFGISGLAGLALFAIGMYFLFPEGFRVSTAVIGSVVAICGAMLGMILVALVSSRSHGPMIGSDAIRRREGVVDSWDSKEGWVIVEGERWRARSDKPLNPGDKIRVIEVDGLVLVVRLAKAGSLLPNLNLGEA